MRQEIVEKVSAAARNAGLDAVIAISPENFAYLSGFVVPSQPLIRHRHAAAIVTASGGTAVFGVDMEASTIRRRLPDLPSAIWKEFSDDAMTVLAAASAKWWVKRDVNGARFSWCNMRTPLWKECA